MMKRIIMIAPAILFLMSGAAIGQPYILHIVVPADEPTWTNTGERADETIGFDFLATGLACYDTTDDCQNGEAWTGPDGSEETADETFLAPGLKKHALVGKIGQGDPFLIGSSAFIDCGPHRGNLLLAYNDSEFSDNSGSYEVGIAVLYCDNFCGGSAEAATYQESPVYGTSDLGKHLVYFLLPGGAVVLLRFWRRRR
jgi:hypothetical protein